MLERRNIHAAGLVQRVNAIVQGDVAHMALREINLGVLPAHDVVTAKTEERGDAVASLIDDNAVLAEIAGAVFTVNYAMLY